MVDQTVSIDLLAPETIRHPYPVYALLRAEAPVYWSESLGCWVLTRYEDIAALVYDERLRAGWDQPPMLRALSAEEQAAVRDLERIRFSMLASFDGAEHQRQRALAQSAFTPRVVERMRGDIQTLVDGLLDAVAPHGQIDFIRDVALPLPMEVIFRLLDVPHGLRGTVKAGADALVAGYVVRDPAPGQLAELQARACAGEQCVRDMITARRERLGDDLLSRLLEARQNGQRLSDAELCGLVYTLLLAGFESTVNMIGNGLLTLLTHPEQLGRLHAEPALIEPAAEELMRFETPVPFVMRRASAPIALHGVAIQPGQKVMLLLAAANRDPQQFPEPDRLDLARAPNRHLAFSHGPHFCLGAALARLEAQIALGTTLRRLPNLRLAAPPATLEWYPALSMRGLLALPLVFDPPV